MPQVFYRKWRPRLLSDVVGQDHVTRTLQQAVSQQRIAHAYMFCGPRGTGKTSTARILAKAINCHSTQKGEPCNQCSICKSFNDASSLDLIEIDAASQRRIDDIRDLREKINFTPSEATYKVYIVDEVHMLTAEAFNALLKTLEEPPSHAIFILATTEIDRVPATVISRCQRFDFHRISQNQICERLENLCKAENVDIETQVLVSLARASEGSLRDAENMLEQLVVSSESRIELGHLKEMLGLAEHNTALTVIKSILTRETQIGLQAIASVSDSGVDLRNFHRQITDLLRSVLLFKAGGKQFTEYSKESEQTLLEIADASNIEDILHALRTFHSSSTRRDMSSTISMEIALMECCLRETTSIHVDHQISKQSEGQTSRNYSVEQNNKAVQESGSQIEQKQEDIANHDEPHLSPSLDRNSLSEDQLTEQIGDTTDHVDVTPDIDSESHTNSLQKHQLDDLYKATKGLKPNKYNIGSLLLDCAKGYISDDNLVLEFKTRPNMERFESEMEHPETRRLILESVRQVTGTPYNIKTAIDDSLINNVNAPKGHLIRAARSIGAQIIDTPEIK